MEETEKKYFHIKGFTPRDVKNELNGTLGASYPSFNMIKKWMAWT